MRDFHTIVLTALLFSSTLTASASDLPTALSLLAEGRLGEALEAFDQALMRPGTSPNELATIYGHLSVLRSGMGDQAGARDALQGLRSVDPDASLPPTAPPELLEIFEEVNQMWGDRQLAASIDAPAEIEEGQTPTIQVHVVDDVAGLVGGADLLRGTDVVATEQGRGPFSFTLPESAVTEDRFELSVRLVNEHGGVLWQGETFEIAIATVAQTTTESVEETPAPAPEPGRPRALRIAGWTLFGAGLATVAAGAVLAGMHERETGETRVENGVAEKEIYLTGTAGWVLLGIGSAALVAGIVLVVLGPRRSAQQARALRLAQGVVAQW